MPATTPVPATPRKAARLSVQARRVQDAVALAGERGLLSGARDRVVRGRMPSALVEQAKRRTGIQSDSRLVEAALASLVVDDYAAWLLANEGTVDPDLDLEY